MYVKRLLRGALEHALAHFPAVLVTGPRQSGKTTFLRHEGGAGTGYVSLDDPLERELARDDPNAFLDRFGERRVILDEIQNCPELLPHLKMRVDTRPRRGARYLLTGSQQLALGRDVAEHLVGRIAILELLPFSLLEHAARGRDPLAATIWSSGFPAPALAPATRDLWLRSYLQTYVERDIRRLRNITDLRSFQAFVALCAARHAQELNLAELARELGISQPTARAWLSVLEAAHLVRLVPPYFRNLGKRVIKAPKLFFLDSGLVCELTRQPAPEAALAGAMGGALFEGFIATEAMKAYAAAGLRPDIFFWRSHGGPEVDLVLGVRGTLVPVEVKLTASPTARHGAALTRFRELVGEEAAAHGMLVCRVPKARELPGGHVALPWREFPSWLAASLATRTR